MNKDDKQIKFGFGTDEEHCFGDEFDTVQELINFATEEWEDQNSDYYIDDDDNLIYIGVIEHHKPSDFVPSLSDIADQMTDKFYCDHNIDDDSDCGCVNKEEAEREFKAFIDKYFYLPCEYTTVWNVGQYDVKNHQWVEKFGMYEKYVVQNNA